MAATAAASGDVLPELFEVQRDVDKTYLFAESYERICDGKFDSAYDWDDGSRGTNPLHLWMRHERSEALSLRRYLVAQHKKAVPVLGRYLKDYDPRLRLFAAYCAALLGPKAGELSKELGSALGDRRGFPEVKSQASNFEVFYLVELLYAMAEVGPDREKTKAVGALLLHADARVQATAAWLVSQPGFDREEALTALSQVPEMADSMVRLHFVLARLRLEGKEERAAQELDRFLDDKKEEVKYQAARALCKLGRGARPSMETFRKWAKGNQHERMCAAEAYWAIAGETQTAVSLFIWIANEHGADECLAKLAERIGPEAEPLRRAMTTMRLRGQYEEANRSEFVPLPRG
jgi:hypothetical protein